MDYRIVQTKEQKFIALVRSFRNETINEEENHDIPDFWGECHDVGCVFSAFSVAVTMLIIEIIFVIALFVEAHVFIASPQ